MRNKMEKVLLNPSTKSELRLLLELAKKMGISGRVITSEEAEEIGLLNAMKEAENDKFVDEAEIMKILKK
jgi:enoyl-CoA hydratase/carnithine racemase